ncbi:PEPxxWA-CTERM sorting domain-containing protein [Erythrobacter sp. QSSC1-22B]|uniref:PEPxxWA-CTERM sorting domain-containing protein n=1 Tax=Erythrobacter sp. QSSC1-22B TaxID=1860125 RepID=UPI000A4E17A2|nr:PEPxxWA-CTERM sorting domain-containing protein [Erythrobacter sp. QSSC1-22B]
MKADSATALNALLGTSYTGQTLTWLENLDSLSGNSVNFMTPLFGDTVVSFHVGAARGNPAGVGYQSTAFYRFDAGNVAGGFGSIGFNLAGLSNSRLYSTGTAPAVPEPTTWAMMLLGFGFVGGAMRAAKRRQKVTVSYA